MKKASLKHNLIFRLCNHRCFFEHRDVSPRGVRLSSKREFCYLYLHLPVLASRVTLEIGYRAPCRSRSFFNISTSCWSKQQRGHLSTSPGTDRTICRPSLQFDLPQNTIAAFGPSTAAYVVLCHYDMFANRNVHPRLSHALQRLERLSAIICRLPLPDAWEYNALW